MNVTHPGTPDIRAVAKMINLEIIHHYYRLHQDLGGIAVVRSIFDISR